MKLLIISLLLPVITSGQEVHTIPSATGPNTIHLTLENPSDQTLRELRIIPLSDHDWISFQPPEITISSLRGRSLHTIQLGFTVDRSAPVNSEHMIRIGLASSSGQSWSKELTIRVAPPHSFGLFQNYPNPFNPTTVIAYQLPVASIVTIRVYNTIGQEVAVVADAMRGAGYHEEPWDASHLASGMYIYQLSAIGTDGTEFSDRRAMMVLK